MRSLAVFFCFFKQKTAYEMRISDWSSDVCSSDLGAIVMRGAGCVYNDIVDRDLDAKVARTASRPVASGAVSMVSALLWTLFLSLVGLLVLLQLTGQAQIVALTSLILVAGYPFMKRILWRTQG